MRNPIVEKLLSETSPEEKQFVKEYAENLLFKDKVQTEIIPRLKTMLQNERKHLIWMKRQLKDFPFLEKTITPFLKTSNEMIIYLETRLEEYKNYYTRVLVRLI